MDYVLCLQGRYQDCSKATIADETAYTAPSNTRDSAYRYLIGAKMDEDQNLKWLTDLVNTTPLTQLSWTFTTQGTGAYRFYYISVPFYNSGATYTKEVISDGVISSYANIIYYPGNQTLYKAIGTNFIAIEPTVSDSWENYWEVFDPTLFDTQLNSTTIEVFRSDDIITCEYETCILDRITELEDEAICGVCINDQAFMELSKMEFLLDAANSNNWQDKATRSETILKEAMKKYCKC
jgi:hypothetical protein